MELLEIFICDNCDDLAFVSQHENTIEIVKCACASQLFTTGEAN